MVNIHASSVGYSILDFEIGSKIEWEMMLNLLIWGSQTCIHEAQASLLILLVPWERLDSILESKRKFALHMSKWIREMNTRVWLMRIMSLHLIWRWHSWSSASPSPSSNMNTSIRIWDELMRVSLRETIELLHLCPSLWHLNHVTIAPYSIFFTVLSWLYLELYTFLAFHVDNSFLSLSTSLLWVHCSPPQGSHHMSNVLENKHRVAMKREKYG